MDQTLNQTDGGDITYSAAAGVGAATTQIATGPGRLCLTIPLSSGSAQLDFYDNATGDTTGPKIHSIPANPTVGLVSNPQINFKNGLTVNIQNNTSAVAVSYTCPRGNGPLKVSTGGDYTASVAAGGPAVQATLGHGRLMRVTVLSSGSAQTDFYDNAAGDNSGAKIASIPANPTVGAVYSFRVHFALGLTIFGTTNTSALSVSLTHPDWATQRISDGGENTVSVAAGTVTVGQQLATGNGLLNTVEALSSGATQLDFYDNAAGDNSGAKIFSLVGSPGVGVVQNPQVPFAKGLVAYKASGTSACAVGFNGPVD